jgi:hypothetical protein
MFIVKVRNDTTVYEYETYEDAMEFIEYAFYEWNTDTEDMDLIGPEGRYLSWSL